MWKVNQGNMPVILEAITCIYSKKGWDLFIYPAGVFQ